MSFLEEEGFEIRKEMHFTAEGMRASAGLIREKHREIRLL